MSGTGNAMRRLWCKVPLVLRAIIAGFLVFAVCGSVIWTLLLMLVPAPWSMLAMAVVLVLYWKYFSGSGWPFGLSEFRRELFRATRLSPRLWTWSLIAALLGVVVIQSGIVVSFRLMEYDPDKWSLGVDLGAAPAWMAWLFVVMAALVAGLTEEVGFRGYMQLPIERRYGPWAGVGIVSVVFMLAHLNQAWAPSVLLQLFLISAMWGVLAYVSGSIIPGIVSHTVTDIFNFAYWWTNLAGRFTRRPISETGADAHFLAWLLILVVSTTLLVWSMRRTWKAR